MTSPLLSHELVFLAAPPIILNELLHTNRKYFGEGGGDHGSFLTVLVRGYMLLSMVFILSACVQIISFGVSLVGEVPRCGRSYPTSPTRPDLSYGNDGSSRMHLGLGGNKDDDSDSEDDYTSDDDLSDETDDDSDDGGTLHGEEKEDSKERGGTLHGEEKEDSKEQEGTLHGEGKEDSKERGGTLHGEEKEESKERIGFEPPSVRCSLLFVRRGCCLLCDPADSFVRMSHAASV